MQTYLIIALVSYLLGSIPFGYILVRIFLKQDIRETGSGNIGATNVARSGAKGLAIATLLLDATKGTTAALIGAWLARTYSPPLDLDHWVLGRGTNLLMIGASVAGLAAIIGHMYPIWLGFRGGKGVATAVGAFLILDPSAVAFAFLVFAATVALTRYVSLGSIVASIVFPIAIRVLDFTLARHPRPAVSLLMALISALLIILKHHANIRRLLAGTEPKFGAKKPIPPPQEMEKQA